jgi:hypothetical protein
MRRFLLIASVIGGLTVAGASAVQAAAPGQFVGWDHHRPVVVDRWYHPPVRYARPEVVYYPQVVAAPTIVAAPPVLAAPPVVVAPPAGFVSIGGRHFGIRFGF